MVHFLTLAQCAELSYGFQCLANSSAFSQSVGAIDRGHICIKALHGPHTEDYLNKKWLHFVQVICNTGTFLDIFVGYPGSVHDTRVLRNGLVFVRSCYTTAGYFWVSVVAGS